MYKITVHLPISISSSTVAKWPICFQLIKQGKRWNKRTDACLMLQAAAGKIDILLQNSSRFQCLFLQFLSMPVLHPGLQESWTLSQLSWVLAWAGQQLIMVKLRKDNRSQSFLSTVCSDQRLFLYLESTRPHLTHDSFVSRLTVGCGINNTTTYGLCSSCILCHHLLI